MPGQNWRRQGLDPDAVPRGLRDAFEQTRQELGALDDPVAIVRAIGDLLAGLDEEVESIGAVRLDAVARLRRDGWSYDKIAAETGISKARAAQLSRLAKSRT